MFVYLGNIRLDNRSLRITQKQQQKTNLKLGKGFDLQRRNTDDQQAPGKMLSVIIREL